MPHSIAVCNKHVSDSLGEDLTEICSCVGLTGSIGGFQLCAENF